MAATSHNWAELLTVATPEERALAMELVANFGQMWAPLPGPQTLAFNSEADIIGYGGAGGGGKTDLAIGAALCLHRRTAVFRLNGTEHPAFIDRLEEVLGSRDGYNSKDGIWRITLPKGKRIQIEMGSMPNAGDERKYRGRPHDLKVFDEVAEIPEDRVRFLLAWLRTTTPGQRCQALLCFNPPTSSDGRWVVTFFAPWLDKKYRGKRAMPGELRWFASIKGKDVEVPDNRPFVLASDSATRVYDFDPKDYRGTEATKIIRPLSRTFIPARVTDNPYYATGAYMSQLQALPEPLRSQMLNGDFEAGMQDGAMQLCPTAWVEAAQKRWVDLHAQPGALPEMDSLGADVARGGADNTLIARRHGMWFDRLLKYPGSATPDGPTVASLVIANSRDGCPQHIDVIGVGASPYDFLVEANQPVIGVDVRQAAGGTDRSGMLKLFNKRTELGWALREALDPKNNTGIALPPDTPDIQLSRELCSVNWEIKGKTIKVESREDIIKRLHWSPDVFSAVCLALIESVQLRDIPGVHNAHKRGQYDPYANLG